MTPLTFEELAALEALEKAATQPPWRMRRTDDASHMNAVVITTDPLPAYPRAGWDGGHDGMTGADPLSPDAERHAVAATLLQVGTVAFEQEQWDENAELIAALRNAAPRLLAEVRALRKVATSVLESYDDDCLEGLTPDNVNELRDLLGRPRQD